jgi:hypothetical protein
MKNIELLKKVADLVGFQFSSYKFAEATLEGGVVITNSSEGEDFLVGDTISIKNEDGTFTIVGEGTHQLADGRVFMTDVEGKLVEIKSEDTEERIEVEVEMEEVAVEVPTEVVDVMSPAVVSAVVEALTPIVEELKMISEEMKKMKKDYNEFKKTASHNPLKEDKVISQNFSDHRYDILKEMKSKLR